MKEDLRITDLRTFSSVADTLSFTRTGDMLGATQSAISLRIQRLEKQVGRKLLVRTPRGVALTADGTDFLSEARLLLDQHDAIIHRAGAADPATELRLGISNHFAGGTLPAILAHLARALPDLLLNVEVTESVKLNNGFEAGKYDAVILREIHDEAGPKGLAAGTVRRICPERLHWFAPQDFVWRPGAFLPIVTLSPSCHIRDASLKALDIAGIPRREVFMGGGIGILRAAVTAGLGLTCLGSQNQPDRSRDVSEEYGLPLPPHSAYTLLLRAGIPLTKAQTTALVAAFKGHSD